MCFECFGLAQANRSANLKIKCPYYRTSNDNCSFETDTWDIHKAGGNVLSQTILQPKELRFDDLSVDVLADIYAFLPLKNIMGLRGINKKSREAVRMTIVPPTDFVVDSVKKYENMRVMARAMPNLQQIEIGSLCGGHVILLNLGQGHKYNDGEDPNEEVTAQTAQWTTHDIEIISNFRKLRNLILNYAPLNGRYPVLFNSFPLLQKLSIQYCHHLKFDLEMLAELPVLKELECQYNHHLTGKISSLRVLKDTLEKVIIKDCYNVEGNFMDLANFLHLNELDLRGTAITGDIRDIGETDFSSLEQLILPKEVYGISGYELQRISDAPELIRAVYLLKKQRPALINIILWYVQLSDDSPDWYESVEDDDYIYPPPFLIQFVTAGSRVGYRWRTHSNPCEVNWLDPEPDKDSSDYEIYSEELQTIENQVGMYRGFRQPPTEEEYRRLIEG